MCNSLIVSDERTREVDCCRDQKPIGRIAMFEMVQLVTPGGSAMAERNALNARIVEETVNPGINRKIEVDPSDIDKGRDLPGRHSAEENGAAPFPAAINQGARRSTQPFIPALEPKGDVGIE
jgi:hypothetical protein